MGFVRTRSSSDGETRYLALYCDVKGRQRSAGTFATAEKATRAWQKAEERISEGRLGDARRGRQKFARYVEEQWLPHHQMEARTRENYTYYLGEHILPVFGTMRLIEILPGRRPGMGHGHEERGRVPHRDPVLLRDPVRDLHHRVQRPTHRTAPLPRREDPARAQEDARHRHPEPSSTRSTRSSRTTSRGYWWRPTSRPGCAGANSPNSAPPTSTPPPASSPCPASSSSSSPKFHPDGRPIPDQALPERSRTPPPQTQPARA